MGPIRRSDSTKMCGVFVVDPFTLHVMRPRKLLTISLFAAVFVVLVVAFVRPSTKLLVVCLPILASAVWVVGDPWVSRMKPGHRVAIIMGAAVTYSLLVGYDDYLSTQQRWEERGGDAYAKADFLMLGNNDLPLLIRNTSQRYRLTNVKVRVVKTIPLTDDILNNKEILLGDIEPAEKGRIEAANGLHLSPGVLNAFQIEVSAKNSVVNQVLDFDKFGKFLKETMKYSFR
jgi:hypothetical protein